MGWGLVILGKTLYQGVEIISLWNNLSLGSKLLLMVIGEQSIGSKSFFP